MKKYLIAIALILFLTANANALALTKHEIKIQLQPNGFAFYKEKYFLDLNIEEKEAFLKAIQKNGKDFISWKIDYNFIYPRFKGTRDTLTNIENVVFNENTLEIGYERDREIALQKEEDIRKTVWNISENEFKEFVSGTTFNIPETTLIEIQLPEKGNALRDKTTPEIVVDGRNLSINKFQGSSLKIWYSIEKPIAPTIKVNELIEEFLKNKVNQFFLLVAVILVILLFVLRKPVIKKIEEYVIENSEIEKEEKEVN